MLFGDASSSGLYIDIAIMLMVGCILLFERSVRKKSKEKMAEVEQKIAALEQFQSAASESFEKAITQLKEMLLKQTNPLTKKLNELSKNARVMHERNQAIRRELEQKIGPLRASIDDTAAKFSSSHDTIRKIVQQGKNEIDIMNKDIDIFAQEIQKMKDFIRERIIDLEL